MFVAAHARRILSGFSGGGGWEVALQHHGHHATCIEYNKDAVATLRAAGFGPVVHDSITAVRDMVDNPIESWFEGHIFSPPCQPFSVSGKKEGVPYIGVLIKALRLIAFHNQKPESAINAVGLDERAMLTLEPMYWITRGTPGWAVMEQVPTVLPIWEAYATILREYGYKTWAGVLNAEQYGTPQARRRAVLIAHDSRAVGPPTPTHSQYHRRSPERLDEGVLPWVSMAEALARPDDELVGFPRRYDGRGDVIVIDGNEYRARDMRPTSLPAQVVTEKARSWQVIAPNGGDTSWVTRRPSPTIVGSFRPDIVAAPGYRKAGDGPRQNQPGSVKITVQEAGVLQGFPRDYPWQGSRSAQFLMAGNAVPVQMAKAVLGVVL